MSNFEKKLEDASDDDLKRWINQYDPVYVSLASNELTRRTILRLKKSIDKLNDSTTKWSKVLVALTLILLVVAVSQTIISITLGGLNPWTSFFAEIIFFVILFYSGWKIFKDFFKK